MIGSQIMFRNYIKIAFRNLRRQKQYSFINIGGLAIGLACCILILLWVQDELSFDRQNEYSDRIYRIERHFLGSDGATVGAFCSLAPSFTPFLKADFPEIEKIARFTEMSRTLVNYENKNFYEDRFCFAEDELFDILSIRFLRGDPGSAIRDPNTVVISESMAGKYFGSENPVGKRLKIDGTDFYQVTGVFKDMPRNSHLHFDFLGSLITLKGMQSINGDDFFFGTRNFSDNVTYTYIRLAKDADPGALSGRLPGFLDRHLEVEKDNSGSVVRPSRYNKLFLRKVTDIHLTSNTRNELEPNGDMKYVTLFSLVAVVILIIACVNFVNLATARAARRAREVGLRKTVGANRSMLVAQFLLESVLVSLSALAAAVVCSAAVLPYLSVFAGREMTIGALAQPSGIAMLAGVFFFTVVVSGLYPAVYLARFQPAYILRGELTRGTGGSQFRTALVVIQFAISVVLIISVGVLSRQMHFLQNADLGFDKENIVLLPADNMLLQHWSAVKQSLLGSPSVVSVTLSKRAPAGRLMDAPGFTAVVNGRKLENPFSMPHNRVDFDFFRTYGMKIVAGRDFSTEYRTDSTEVLILNETAVKQLGLSSPVDAIGIPVTVPDRPPGKVVGVVADFNYESMHHKIVPMITYIAPGEANTLAIRLAPGNPKDAIGHIRAVWERAVPGSPFDPEFMNERLNALYRNEERMMDMFGYFSVLAIFIASLGLFGLASFTTEQRTKEIGVRKVLGASIPSIVMMLSKQFTKWVLIANVIAWPVAYYLMNMWLQNFAYRVSVGLWVFVLAGSVSLGIALLTVSYQSVKAARANPVESLKYE
jgi:putative ABC transport system permease protein